MRAIVVSLLAMAACGTPRCGGSQTALSTAPGRAPVAAANTTSPATDALVEGDVLAEDGRPVAGALVLAMSGGFDPDISRPIHDVRANAAGHFRMTGLTRGRYAFTATHGQFLPAYGGVRVIDAATAPALVLRLGRGGATLTGTVTDENGSPLRGAHVLSPTLSENEDEVYAAIADAAGAFVLTVPVQPEYFVAADAHGHARVTVRADGRSPLRLVAPPPPAPRPPDGEIVRWLAARATALPDADVMGERERAAVGALVGDASVVGLGEATHGSAEWCTWRQRIFDALVTTKGFTVLALETGLPDADALEAYVSTGRGDPSAALRALDTWPLETTEQRAFLDWMRAWNADPRHATKLHVAAFDVVTKGAVPGSSPTSHGLIARRFCPRGRPWVLSPGPTPIRRTRRSPWRTRPARAPPSTRSWLASMPCAALGPRRPGPRSGRARANICASFSRVSGAFATTSCATR